MKLQTAHRLNWLFLLCIVIVAYAQEFRFAPSELPVEINGFSVNSPFSGAFGCTKFQFIDINNDGDLDFLSAPTNGNIRLFRNIGSRKNLRLSLDDGVFTGITSGRDFGLADLDNDSDLDLFVLSTNNILFYINTGTPSQPQFLLSSQPLLPFELETPTALTFSDIDRDGDFDLFIGHQNGTISYLENVGSPFLANFVKNAGLVSALNFEYSALPSLTDIDDDGDFDLYVGVQRLGFFTGGGIRFYRNVGDPHHPIFAHESDDFIPRLVSESFPYHRFADLDADGALELFVRNDAGNLDYYRNAGSATSERFQAAEGLFISLDNGFESSPSLADVDGDGDLDLLKIEGKSQFVRLIDFYKNDGNRSNSKFSLRSLVLPNYIGMALYPTGASFADLDDDGDLDFILGEASGHIVLHENVALNPAAPQFVVDSILARQNAPTMPALVDIDADKDFDLFVGNAQGRLYFYRNLGNPAQHNFTLESEDFLAKTIPRMAPCFFDADTDQDFDLLLGTSMGTMQFYRNIGSPQQPNFALENEDYVSYDLGANSSPAVGDIDNDGDFDIFSGSSGGGISFFKNDTASSIISPEPENLPTGYRLRQNYPNPCNTLTFISYELPRTTSVNVSIYNLLGERIVRLVDAFQASGAYLSSANTS